jgi:MtN3 and saliva related transmembrane protein
MWDWALFWQIVGYVAAVGTTISFVPQAVKCIVTKDTKNISLWMYVLFVFGTACWAAYGFGTNNLPVIIANVITLVLASTILVLKIINLKKDKTEKA